MKPTPLVLALFVHPPPGGAEPVPGGAELAECFARAVDPALELLRAHAQLKAALHLAGPLWTWMERARPAALERIGALIERGQVEVLGGGFESPILAALPDRDAQGQLEAMQAQVRSALGVAPTGLWLTERVLDPVLVERLASLGLRFAFVDSAHLRAAGIAGVLGGYHVTSRAGAAVALLPIDEALSEGVARGAPEGVFAALDERAPGDVDPPHGRARVLAVDLEALAQHPGALEALCVGAREWILPSEVLSRFTPQGRVTLSASSARWCEPGAGALHARMLHTSKKLAEAVAEVGETERLSEARTALFRAQGAMGQATLAAGAARRTGLLHAAVRALIQADVRIDAETRGEGEFIEYEEDDLDADLRDEALLANAQLSAWVKPDVGGALTELDLRSLAVCLTQVPGQADGVGPRLGFVDRFFAPGARAADADVGGFAGQPYAIEASGVDEEGDLSASVTLVREGALALPEGPRPLLVEKTFHVPIDAARLEVEYIIENLGDAPLQVTFAPELHLAALDRDTAPSLELPDGTRIALGAPATLPPTRSARVVHAVFAVALTFDRPAEIWSAPIRAEDALVGVGLLLRLPLSLPPRESTRLVVGLEVVPLDRDAGAARP